MQLLRKYNSLQTQLVSLVRSNPFQQETTKIRRINLRLGTSKEEKRKQPYHTCTTSPQSSSGEKKNHIKNDQSWTKSSVRIYGKRPNASLSYLYFEAPSQLHNSHNISSHEMKIQRSASAVKKEHMSHPWHLQCCHEPWSTNSAVIFHISGTYVLIIPSLLIHLLVELLHPAIP